MLAFIDESGDAGLSRREGSSAFFVLTLVLFDDRTEAGAADRAIGEVRQAMSLPGNFEFKFNKLNRNQRMEFLRVSSGFRFSYSVIVIDKEKFKQAGLRAESLSNRAIQLLFGLLDPILDDAVIVVDGKGNKALERALKTLIRQQVTKRGAIAELKLQDSRSNNLLQLADIVSGAVLRSLSAKNDAMIYRELVTAKEAIVDFWPK